MDFPDADDLSECMLCRTAGTDVHDIGIPTAHQLLDTYGCIHLPHPAKKYRVSVDLCHMPHFVGQCNDKSLVHG